MIAYYKLFGDIPDGDYESCVAFLEKELRNALTAAYEDEFDDAEVRHFNDAARRLYTLFFDCTEDYESTDIYSRAARVVFVYGRSSAGTKERDSKRMQQFLGAFKDQPEYIGYDKGHFIAHCNDGQIDQNLYPQLKELNRGLSAQGKLFRSMERYLQRNEGVFYFVRPVYNDLTWIPHQLTLAYLRKRKVCYSTVLIIVGRLSLSPNRISSICLLRLTEDFITLFRPSEVVLASWANSIAVANAFLSIGRNPIVLQKYHGSCNPVIQNSFSPVPTTWYQ